VPANGEVYSYARIRAPAPEPGSLVSHSWLANGQFFGEGVPMPGTRTMLDLWGKRKYRIEPGGWLLLLYTILTSINCVPQYLKVACSREARLCGHDCSLPYWRARHSGTRGRWKRTWKAARRRLMESLGSFKFSTWSWGCGVRYMVVGVVLSEVE
jgi:hypothetical protein